MHYEQPRSIWIESEAAGMILHQLHMAGHATPEAALAQHLGWTPRMTRSRLRIYGAVTGVVVHLAGASREQMRELSLARLLDVSRKPTVEDRAICLAYIIHGRHPLWADTRPTPRFQS